MEKTSGSQSADTSSKPVSEQEFRQHILGLTFVHMKRGTFNVDGVAKLHIVKSIYDRLDEEQKKLLAQSRKNSRTMTP